MNYPLSLLAFVSFALACGESSGVDGGTDGAASDGAPIDAGIDAAHDAGPPDPSTPRGVRFSDRDLARGLASGTASIDAATDESAIDRYELVFLDSGRAPIGDPIAAFARGETLEHILEETRVPDGAIEIAAIAVGPGGRSAPSPGAPADRHTVYTDVGGAFGTDYLHVSDITRDPDSEAIYVVGVDAGDRMTIRSCSADGSSCVEDAVLDDRLERLIGADVYASRLYVIASRQGRRGEQPGRLVVCELDDGAIGGCTLHSFAGTPAGDVIATSRGVYAVLYGPDGNPRVAHCPLAGATAEDACVVHDVSADAADYLGHAPILVADDDGLYASGFDGTHAWLFACGLDEDGAPVDCARTELSIGWPFAIDLWNGRVLVTSDSQLARCGASAGMIGACEVFDRGLGSTFDSAVVNDFLISSGRSPGGGDGVLESCAMSEDGIACESSGSTYGGELALIGETEVIVSGARVPHLVRCTRESDDAVFSCESHEVPVEPPGFHGTPIGIAMRGERLLAATHGSYVAHPILVSCALAPDGALDSCAQRETPADGFTDHRPHASSSAVHFFGVDAERRSYMRSCDLDAEGFPSDCADHTFEGGEVYWQTARVIESALFVAAGAVEPEGIDAIACAIDGEGAPSRCARTHIDRRFDSNVAVTGSDRAIYVARMDYPNVSVHACPYADSSFGACVETPIGAFSSVVYDLLAEGDVLYIAGSDLAGRPALHHCALSGDGSIDTCTAYDFSTLPPDMVSSGRLALVDGALLIAHGLAYVGRAGLVRCALDTDGTPSSCEAYDLAVDEGDGSALEGLFQFAADRANGAAYYLTADPRRRLRPIVISIPPF